MQPDFRYNRVIQNKINYIKYNNIIVYTTANFFNKKIPQSHSETISLSHLSSSALWLGGSNFKKCLF